MKQALHTMRRRAGAAAVGALLLLAAAQGRAAEGQSLIDALIATLSAQAAAGVAGIERQLDQLDPLLVETAAPIVADLIVDSRDAAVADGVAEIPDGIRAELQGYVPAAVLDRVRWCTGCGGELSLQRNAFRLGYSPAMTLDDVVVFESRDDALTDPSLWAHELKHVMQFQEWGVGGFAARYLDDYEAVEKEAWDYRWQWMKQTHYLERRRAEAQAHADSAVTSPDAATHNVRTPRGE